MALGPTLGRWACSQAAQSLLASLPQWECLESYRTGRCSKDRINLPQHHGTQVGTTTRRWVTAMTMTGATCLTSQHCIFPR